MSHSHVNFFGRPTTHCPLPFRRIDDGVRSRFASQSIAKAEDESNGSIKRRALEKCLPYTIALMPGQLTRRHSWDGVSVPPRRAQADEVQASARDLSSPTNNGTSPTITSSHVLNDGNHQSNQQSRRNRRRPRQSRAPPTRAQNFSRRVTQTYGQPRPATSPSDHTPSLYYASQADAQRSPINRPMTGNGGLARSVGATAPWHAHAQAVNAPGPLFVVYVPLPPASGGHMPFYQGQRVQHQPLLGGHGYRW